MADWLSSMQQTFEYHVVDPKTWKDSRQLKDVISCNISRDTGVETLGSATISIGESVGECYIRVYLVTIQNGVKERHPLGVFLVQSPTYNFDGKVRDITADAYTPLLELKESPPPIGYYIAKKENVMDSAYRIIRENARAPVVPVECSTKLFNDFVANTDDTWLSFVNDLVANAKYKLTLDEMGRILFEPDQDTASLQPVWTFNDDNSSILYPDVSIDHDLYEIPNVVEVTYSTTLGQYHARVVNDDSNSPISTVNRGREIIYRERNPSVVGDPTEAHVKEYAEKLLKALSTLEYKVSYTHGYCPVRIGDCVRLNYEKAGLKNVKAKVISQSINCTPGCRVTETAIFTNKLWR